MTTWTAYIRKMFSTILKGYAAILFLENSWAGLLCLAATFWYPIIGTCGFLGALIGYLTATLLHFNEKHMPLFSFNSMLVGLSIGAFFPVNEYTLVILFIGSILAAFTTVALHKILANIDNLPPLSLPFILVAGITATSIDSIPYMARDIKFDLDVTPLLHPMVDSFFSTLGAIFFTPQPLAGILVFIALLLSSRYLSMLAITGFAIGTFTYEIINITASSQLLTWTGFNFILTAIAIGGFYTVPGKASLIFALLGSMLTIPIIIAIQDLVLVQGLPIMALPFVLITITLLFVLKSRLTLQAPRLAPVPGLPELNFERIRLAAVRNGEADSVSMVAPFYGIWSVYQGFNGEHTHKNPWQHALDFIQIRDGRSFNDDGDRLEDYYCYNLPISSPVNGTVVRVQSNLADNRPGVADTVNNWGNFVLIRMDNDLYVLLAHLRQHSISVKEGERIKPGTVLAKCGNSGRSLQPHIHVQVQVDARLGSPTYPFHLSSVIIKRKDGDNEYKLVSIPEKGDYIQPTESDAQLASDLHLSAGHTVTFAIVDSHNRPVSQHELQVSLSLAGQYRLTSSSGASSAFEEINGVLGFYDRNGIKDSFLDMWLLANGLTPLASQADLWKDEPSFVLFPLPAWQRLLARLWFPLGTGIDSLYTRSWDDHEQCWIQTGRHSLSFGIWTSDCKTITRLQPGVGITEIQMEFGQQKLIAKLIRTGSIGDEGIPPWQLERSREYEEITSVETDHV